MITFSLQQLFPDFLLADRDGYAMAAALARGLRLMCDTVQQGLDAVQDVDRMPEWRLDELAWEYNCLYDYAAATEAKRQWIRDAAPASYMLGTPAAIAYYLSGYFSNVQVEEWWQYGGEPYHFRVLCNGEMTAEAEAWARKAIGRAKNVRSVLDGLTIYRENGIALSADRLIAVTMPVLMCSEEWLCGEA